MSEKSTPCVDITIDWSELEPLTPAARAGIPKQKWNALQDSHGKSEFSYQETTWDGLYDKWQTALKKLGGAELQGSLSDEQKTSVALLSTGLFLESPYRRPDIGRELAVREALKLDISPAVKEEGSHAEWMACELYHLRDETRFKANGWRGNLPQNIIEMTEQVSTWDGKGSPLVVSVPAPAVQTQNETYPDVDTQLLSGKGISTYWGSRAPALQR